MEWTDKGRFRGNHGSQMRWSILAILVAAQLILLARVSIAFEARRLRISDSGRHLVYENGEPFFWLADTGWEIFHRLTR
ncbi:MAG: DUF4038 domain-containing protein, partial [Sedimentisphaerales bacterium]|nr:DUF4038 domain-containing protein [Sedimentisphaerales bacterium]